MEPRTARAPLKATSTAVGGRFDKFGPEEEKASRKADIQETEAVRQMKDAWEACYDASKYKYDDHYQAMLRIVENLRYTAKDVEEFSLVLEEFQHEKDFSMKAGLFLSALINRGKDSDYVIHTQYLDRPPALIGYYNIKNIQIIGDVGHRIGCRMENGSIVVNGNAKECVGERMNGGSIFVNGNVGFGIGSYVEGGDITVKGDAGTFVGWYMKGGTIKLDGDYGSRSKDFKGGRIYHKGRLIASK
jgi:hypothetical protein